MKKSLFLAAMLCSSATFAATGDAYFGAGYHLGSFEPDGFSDANPTALKLEIGKYLTDKVAIEGHFALGVGDDSIDGVKVDIENAVSVFLKGDINLTENANLYGLLGLTKGKFKFSYDGESASESDSGLSYGVGVETATQTGLIFSAEYIIYLGEDDYDYSGFNLGIAKKF